MVMRTGLALPALALQGREFLVDLGHQDVGDQPLDVPAVARGLLDYEELIYIHL
jgi:hypothetical protein